MAEPGHIVSNPPMPPSPPPASPAASISAGYHATEARDRLTKGEKFSYSFGVVSEHMGSNTLNTLANPIFNTVLGLNPIWIGICLGLMRVWDAVTDPVMGAISDNTRTRHGRRRPFMLAGAVAAGGIFPLIWCVSPNWSPTVITIYFLLVCVAFFTAQTIFSVPYTALGYELTPDYHERTRLMAWRAYSGKLSALIFPWALTFTQLSIWGGDTMLGARWMGVGVGIIVALAGLVPVLFTRERFYEKACTQNKIGLLAGIRETCRNRTFLMMIGILLFTILGTQLVNHLGFYVAAYYLFGGDIKSAAILGGIAGNIQLVVGLAAVLVLNKLSQRIGKRRALAVSIGLLVFAGPVTWFSYTPALPYLSLIVPFVTAPAYAGFWLLISSIKADICDFDELQTGLRREGSYASLSAWFTKLAYASTAILSGFILAWVGFRAELGPAQNPGTLLWMKVWFSFVPSLSALPALFLVFRFPITEQMAFEVRRQLEERRGRV